MRARLRWLALLPLRPFAPAWALRGPASLRWGALRLALALWAALAALGALVWTPLIVEALARAHPSLGRLLPGGDTARVWTALVVAAPLLIAAALQAAAARRVPAAYASETLAQHLAAEGRAPALTLRWALPVWALAALLVALNLGVLGLLLLCGALAGAGSVVFLVAYLPSCGLAGYHGFSGFWEGLATLWDYAMALRRLFSAELHLLDGTLADPLWGALLVLALGYVAPTIVALWTLRHAPA